MYRYHTPSGDKSCDGLAMALRAGLPLRDMEMVQFHPTGLLAGPGTRMTGTVLEEGLRGAGGYLLDGAARALHGRATTRAASAPRRDIVSRAIFAEMRAGRTTPNGGVYLAMGAPRARQRARAVQGHGRALRRLRLRSRRRAGRGGADRALHDGRRGVRRRLHAPRSTDCSPRARTPAACTARTAWAATASRTPPCSGRSRATRWRRGRARWAIPWRARSRLARIMPRRARCG